jgi:hypothetical protein
VKPTDWPAVGTLLRVPEVVFLSCLNANNGIPFTKTSFIYNHNDGTLDTATDQFGIDLARTLGIFAAVKGTIEGMRPGRTWVTSNTFMTPDFMDYRPINDSGNAFFPIRAPQIGSVPFFGTRVLHIYAGTVVTQNGSTINAPKDGKVIADGIITYLTGEALLGSPGYKSAAAKMRGAYPKMAGYKAVLYAFDKSFSGVQSNITESFAPIVPPLEDVLNACGPRTVDMMTTIGKDLADVGYSYGGTTDEMSAGEIIDLIRDFFGF